MAPPHDENDQSREYNNTLVDFLDDQFRGESHTFLKVTDPYHEAKPVRGPKPLVAPSEADRSGGPVPFTALTRIEPNTFGSEGLTLERPVQVIIDKLWLPQMGQEQTQQMQAQQAQTQGIETQRALTLLKLSQMELETLSAAETETLACFLKKFDVTLYSRAVVEHAYKTKQLVALCYYLHLYRGNNDPGLFAKFAVHDANRVVSDLIHFAAGVFTAEQIAAFLKEMMLRILHQDMDTLDNVERRLKLRTTLSQCGCQLIQAYHDVLLRHNRYTHKEKTTQRLAELRQLGIPPSNADQIAAAERSVQSESDMEKMISIIFADPALRAPPEPFGWFLGILIEGSGQFVDYLKERKDRTIEATSTALAFLFAVAGFIPLAGQFMGIAGLIVDKTMHHFWKSDNLRPLVTQLDGMVEERINLEMKRRVKQGRITNLEAAQLCDDMVSAKRRTQMIGQLGGFNTNLRKRIKVNG